MFALVYPRNLRARNNLAVILAGRGDDVEALAPAVEALRLAPGYPAVCANARVLPRAARRTPDRARFVSYGPSPG